MSTVKINKVMEREFLLGSTCMQINVHYLVCTAYMQVYMDNAKIMIQLPVIDWIACYSSEDFIKSVMQPSLAQQIKTSPD